MKPPNRLSDEELRKYADIHLKYEIDMLIWTASMLIPLHDLMHDLPIPWTSHNALLESFAIHARNLVDFLYIRDDEKRTDWPTDVIIQDYIDSEILSDALPDITHALSLVNEKANKQVAHLTLERIDYEREGKKWEFGQIVADTTTALRALAGHFPESRMSEGLRNQLQNVGLHLFRIEAKTLHHAASMPVGLSMEVDFSPAGPQSQT